MTTGKTADVFKILVTIVMRETKVCRVPEKFMSGLWMEAHFFLLVKHEGIFWHWVPEPYVEEFSGLSVDDA